jgi:hypothetical protein
MPLLYGDLVCLVAIVKGRGTMLFAVTLVVPGEVQQKSVGASQTRPLGQGGGPATPGERRARPSARPAGMAGRVKVAAAHSRPQDGSNVL